MWSFTISCSTITPAKAPIESDVKAFGAVEHNIRSICCHQSAVTMRFRAGLTSSKLALFSRSGTTSRTVDSEYLFCGDFLFHGRDIAPEPTYVLVNLDQWHKNLCAMSPLVGT